MRPTVPKVLIELKRSRIEGVGVGAVVAISKLQRIASGIHERDYDSLVAWSEFSKLEKDVQTKVRAFCIGTPDGFIPPDDFDFNHLSIDWYFNHSCDGNLGFNEEGDFAARRIIREGEELTYDYRLAESNPDFHMDCKCGASNCSRIITGSDWRDPVFRASNLNWMLPRLRFPAESAAVMPKSNMPQSNSGHDAGPKIHSLLRGRSYDR
jgi:hypothetical protein